MTRAGRRVLAPAAACLAAACSPGDAPVSPSLELPRWQAASLDDGRRVGFEASDGAVVVNVWATWCEPCRREMASLEKAHLALAPRGIRVVGVSVDRDVLLAREFVRRLGLTFPNLSDPAQALVRDRLGVTRLPTTLAIGRDGRVRWREEAARDWSEPGRLAWVERSLAPGGR